MVADTSAVVAIFLNEPECAVFQAAIDGAASKSLSAVTAVECSLVIESRLGPKAGQELEAYLQMAGLAIHPVTRPQVEWARAAWRHYGRGRHPAGLNLGDCFAYALARSLHQPLLFNGNAFAQTDIRPAL
ncbi:MAG: type II toxin-antitoxin system VapC family toxin [Terriglobales bacterium]